MFMYKGINLSIQEATVSSYVGEGELIENIREYMPVINENEVSDMFHNDKAPWQFDKIMTLSATSSLDTYNAMLVATHDIYQVGYVNLPYTPIPKNRDSISFIIPSWCCVKPGTYIVYNDMECIIENNKHVLNFNSVYSDKITRAWFCNILDGYKLYVRLIEKDINPGAISSILPASTARIFSLRVSISNLIKMINKCRSSECVDLVALSDMIASEAAKIFPIIFTKLTRKCDE